MSTKERFHSSEEVNYLSMYWAMFVQVIVLWTANTERFCDVRRGLNDTSDTLLRSIRTNEEEVSPSTIFAVASILEGVRKITITNIRRAICLIPAESVT